MSATPLSCRTLPIYRFLNSKWTMVSNSSPPASSFTHKLTSIFSRPKTPPLEEKKYDEQQQRLERLKIMTYNVWFDDFARKERTALLLQHIQTYAPDVIGLQEVLRDTVVNLVAHEYIRTHYYVSDVTGATIPGYGIMLLSRYPMNPLIMFQFETRMARSLLMGTIHVGGQQLSVGTVHLESLQSAHLRASQLHTCAHAMNPLSHTCILMGDFNFDDLQNYRGQGGVLENDVMKQTLSTWIDSWTHLKPKERGATFTPQLNPMLKDYHETARYDRMMVKPATLGGWTPTDLEIIGTQPVNVTEGIWMGKQIVPSDHFGLLLTLDPVTVDSSSSTTTNPTSSTSTSADHVT